MIVDDVLARIGSANFSNRSMGMDTECDVAVDAAGNPDAQAGIRRIRDRLLAEHLGLSADAVADGVERHGSIRAFVDTRTSADHTLVPIDMSEQAEPPSELLRGVADPGEPVAFGSSVESLVPAADATSEPPSDLDSACRRPCGRDRRRVEVFPYPRLDCQRAVSSVDRDSRSCCSAPSCWCRWNCWQSSPVCISAHFSGGVVALIGSLVAAVIGYVAGRAIGTEALPRWMSRRSHRSVRQLGARGVGGVVMLRLASVASAGSIHLMCGAGRVPFATYLAGTVVALVPAVAALTGLGGLLRHTLLNPSVSNGLTTIGAFVIVFAFASGLRTFLLIRQFAPAISSHRGGAEFG